MFTAFFVLALGSKKIKIGHDIYDLFMTYLKNLKIGHKKFEKTLPIGSLMIVHLAKSGNKK